MRKAWAIGMALAAGLAGCSSEKPDAQGGMVLAGIKPIGGRDVMAFVLPAAAEPAAIEAGARKACAGHSFCQVYGWADPSAMASAWPMLAREQAALSFRYAINRQSDYEEVTWYCGSPGAKADCPRP